MLDLKMSPSSREFINKYCPQMLDAPTLRAMLIEFNEFITTDGLDENDMITDFGRLAESVYDEVYALNH